jgi:hypothetical protein
VNFVVLFLDRTKSVTITAQLQLYEHKDRDAGMQAKQATYLCSPENEYFVCGFANTTKP